MNSLFAILDASGFGANVFLKHLMVLSDYGSEPLQRIKRDYRTYFPDDMLQYAIDGVAVDYRFTGLQSSGQLSNARLKTDAAVSVESRSLSPLYKDLITLLLFGGNATNETIASIFRKCMVGNLIGKSDELREYIKQRYIFVSRITGGAQANDLGQIAQKYARDYLEAKLGEGYAVRMNGAIPGVTHNDDRTLTTFDLCVSKDGKYVGIEISFQVTTNSTIERKSGQAHARFAAVEATGNYIAYIIDGAGNFQRQSALRTICENSHCTVAYTDSEFDVLCNFIIEKLP